MPDNFGLNFAPLNNATPRPGGSGSTPLQEAIRTLSLRLPKVVGAGSPVAQPLLQSQGSAAMARPMAPILPSGPQPWQADAPSAGPIQTRVGQASPVSGPMAYAPSPQAPQFDMETFLRLIFGAGRTSSPQPGMGEVTYPTPRPVGDAAQGPEIPRQAPLPNVTVGLPPVDTTDWSQVPEAPLATPTETPKDALARYTRDYWAPDREQVLTAKRAEAGWTPQ